MEEDELVEEEGLEEDATFVYPPMILLFPPSVIHNIPASNF